MLVRVKRLGVMSNGRLGGVISVSDPVAEAASSLISAAKREHVLLIRRLGYVVFSCNKKQITINFFTCFH